LTSGGLVYPWGANGSGQLGNDTLVGQYAPVLVPGLANVIAIEAGSDHSLAVTSDGRVFSWGSNGAGQLGDGTTTARKVPTQIASITNAVAVAAGASHSLALTSGGQLYGWGGNSFGQLGDGTTTNRLTPVLNGALSGIARIAAGGSHSAAVASDKRIYTWGRNNAGQVGDNSTTNRTAPVLLAGVGGDWVLAAPAITPASGSFTSAQTVTMTPPFPDAQIWYTLDGTEPNGSSLIYSSPFSVAGTVTVRAKAFKVGWAPSVETTSIYTFTNPDVTAPTISVAAAPAPNGAGWRNGTVTVTFTCSDAQSAVVQCGPNATVTADTAGVTVTGIAIDGAGNQSAPASLVIKRDTVAPVVTRHSPVSDAVLPTGITALTVTGTAVDTTSGIVALTCNGAAATLVGQGFTCADLPVTGGANQIRIDATDAAGWLTRLDSIVYVGTGGPAATRLSVSPRRMTMIAGETRALRVRDDLGQVVTTGTWTSDDAGVATVAVADGVATLTAVAAGEADLTVTAGTLTAAATVTVLAAGATIPEGTELWSLDDPPTATTPKRADVLRASWVDSVDPEDQPGLFFVDEGTEWGSTSWGAELMRLYNRPTRIRAVTLDGRELWEHAFTGRRVRHVAADQFGGVVIVRESGSDSPTAAWQPDSITALDGQTGQPRWTYYAREDYSHFTEAAIHPDGTVYVVERGDKNASRLWALHGQTGAAQGWDLASGHATVWVDGVLKSDGPVAATIAGPIVREDGAVVLVSRRHTSEGSFQRVGSVNQLVSGSYDVDVSQIELADGATALSVHTVATTAYPDERLIPGSMDDYRLLPDGAGGVLLGHHQGIDVLRVDPVRTLSARVPLEPLTNSRRPYEAEYVLGEDGAYALINGYDTATYPAPTQYWSKVVRFSTGTLAEEQDLPVGLPQAQPQHHRLQFAALGGSVAVTGPQFGNEARLVDGVVASVGQLPALRGQAGPRPVESLQPFPRIHAPARRYSTAEAAVLAALDFIYPYSNVMNWEFGGLVCQLGADLYGLSAIITDRSQGSVQSLATHSCSVGTMVARYHTHPPKENPNPSGPDVNPDAATATTFNYIRSREIGADMFGMPPVPTQTLRFRRRDPEAPLPWANTCVLQAGIWVPYGPSPTTVCR
jgi:hypothetical protein